MPPITPLCVFDAATGRAFRETVTILTHPTGVAEPRRSIHWAEYAIEAGALGTFMVSAACCAALFFHPASAVAQAVEDPFLRRVCMGLAMGLTAVAIIYSPFGQRSGAHMNPAVTLAFYRLHKVSGRDCIGYVLSQFAGGIAGIGIAAAVLRGAIADPAVNYVATVPGQGGALIAFVAESAISCGLMLAVLVMSNHPRRAHLTGVTAGVLVWAYIAVEAPLSGMSMNPARSLASATLANNWRNLWVYFTAPPLGMLLAAELYVQRAGFQRVVCAKLHHPRHGSCVFGCGPMPDVHTHATRVAP